MSTLMKASTQWMRRPSDERFLSLDEMLERTHERRQRAHAQVLSTKLIEACPIAEDDERRSLVLQTPNGLATPSHWSFGQLCERAGAPAGYLRTLPSDIAADNLNYGLIKNREEIGILSIYPTANDNPVPELAAATGPNYGRVWNEDVIRALRERFGNGVDGDFRVPGEFGRPVPITRANTTLYAGDRDMFVFLADETRRIEIPNRRNGQPGSLARGFFCWNSEVGSQTLGVATFLFDYVCCNRIVWGATEYKELRIRHSSGAPARFIEEVRPALITYARSADANIVDAIKAAQAAKIEEDVDAFLSRRFTRTQAKAISLAHIAEEGRPIETVWDAVTGVTAYAKGVDFQDQRVAIEREAGKLLDLVAA